MYGVNGSPEQRHVDARMLDVAKGIVVALRECSTEQAFTDIVQRAHQHRVGPIQLADALVAIAQNTSTSTLNGAAVTAAQAMWSELNHTDRTQIVSPRQ